MKITESASKAILQVMLKKNLDPTKMFLEINLFNGSLGISFTREKLGKILKFGDLSVVIAHNIDTTDVLIDFTEINGRKGLIFLDEKQKEKNYVK